MVAKFFVVFTATPLRPTGDGPAPRVVLVKEFAGRNPSAVDRHARAWFTAAHPDYRILTLDVHPHAGEDRPAETPRDVTTYPA